MAGDLAIEIKNLDELRAEFSQAPKIIEEELTKAVKEQQEAMAQALSIYPAEKPRQKYKRTNDLGNGWIRGKTVFTVGAGGVTATRRNSVSYAPFVQDETQQAKVHRGRWINTVQQVGQAFESDNARALERAADTTAKRMDREL